MKVSEFAGQIYQRNPLLFRVGLLHFILLGILIVPMSIDTTIISGVNAWFKPMKFAISIGIYLWTIGWVMEDLTISYSWKKILSWIIASTMVIEFIIILYQASRGVTSHFNFSNNFDASLFALMGILIGINTLVVILVTLLYFYRTKPIDALYKLSIKLGLVSFLLSSIIGGIMIKYGSHSIGVPDGGSGIPFFNWSTEGGDLRIAHFLGMHALQIFPLLVYFLQNKLKLDLSKSRMILLSFVLLFSLFYAYVYRTAITGTSLFSFLQ